jgi:crotonobetainyl-CoA:carnitine CoA-transferase CaiB-like acyl-CoA transferase
MPTPQPRPLDGVRVLEVGQLLAGPFAGTLLAYFGAEVIKVEPPGDGDPIRGWRVLDEGTSLWWYSLGRNKKSVGIDLRQEGGRELVRRLAAKVDVILENFKPGTMERWGLGPEDVRRENPRVIYARVSGFGNSGPYSPRPGYASVCEAVGGLRHLNGMPGQPPVRPNLSLGDTLAGLHAALGVLLALLDRERRHPDSGQEVDVAIYEAVFNCLEAVVPEYDRFGVARGPSGTTITGIVPTNTYPVLGGKFVVIGGNGDSIYRRLMITVGRADLADDPGLAHNAGRVERQAEIDAAIAAWTAERAPEEVLAAMQRAEVPAGLIYGVDDMFRDPHFAARGLLEEVDLGGRRLRVPAILPKLTATPGRTEWPGPPVGAHDREVLGGLLGLDEGELRELAARGVLGSR